jgi:hypothetical protein
VQATTLNCFEIENMMIGYLEAEKYDSVFTWLEILGCEDLDVVKIHCRKSFYERFHRVDEEFCLEQLQKEIVLATGLSVAKKNHNSLENCFLQRTRISKIVFSIFRNFDPSNVEKTQQILN